MDEFGNALQLVTENGIDKLVMRGKSSDQVADRLGLGVKGTSRGRQVDNQEASALFSQRVRPLVGVERALGITGFARTGGDDDQPRRAGTSRRSRSRSPREGPRTRSRRRSRSAPQSIEPPTTDEEPAQVAEPSRGSQSVRAGSLRHRSRSPRCRSTSRHRSRSRNNARAGRRQRQRSSTPKQQLVTEETLAEDFSDIIETADEFEYSVDMWTMQDRIKEFLKRVVEFEEAPEVSLETFS